MKVHKTVKMAKTKQKKTTSQYSRILQKSQYSQVYKSNEQLPGKGHHRTS